MKAVEGITYDMQKLDEAVSCLAGSGTLQERLSNAMIPLLTLSAGGMHNKSRQKEFERILQMPDDRGAIAMGDEAAREMAHAIVNLQNGNWHDTVFALEDEIKRLKGSRR